jgi:hypothetical protein
LDRRAAAHTRAAHTRASARLPGMYRVAYMLLSAARYSEKNGLLR